MNYGHKVTNHPIDFLNDSDWVKENFKQIGAHKFDDVDSNEVKKIEKLGIIKSPFQGYNASAGGKINLYKSASISDMQDKINEIIDYLNKE